MAGSLEAADFFPHVSPKVGVLKTFNAKNGYGFVELGEPSGQWELGFSCLHKEHHLRMKSSEKCPNSNRIRQVEDKKRVIHTDTKQLCIHIYIYSQEPKHRMFVWKNNHRE